MTNKGYAIYNDLSNENRKRIDLFSNTKLSEVEELQAYNVTIESQYVNGNHITMYVTLSEISTVETLINNNVISLVKELRSICDFKTDGFGDMGTQITIEGYVHTIFIMVDEQGYALETLHENHKNYGMYEETYKNVCSRKKVKSVLTYVEKYL